MLGGGNKAVTPELKGFVQKENVQSNLRLPERGSSSSHHRGDRSSSGVFDLTDSSHLVVGGVREGGFKPGQANKNQHALIGGSPGWNLILKEEERSGTFQGGRTASS